MDANQRRDIKLGYLIHDVSRMLRTAFDEIVKPLGVTRTQWWVIAHLSRHDAMVQTQLAELLDVGKASLGALLDRLEPTGFIERRPEPSDRRAKRVFLTKTSLQLLERLVLLENEFNDKILTGLTYKDRRELIRLLSIMKENMSAMGPGPDNRDVRRGRSRSGRKSTPDPSVSPWAHKPKKCVITVATQKRPQGQE